MTDPAAPAPSPAAPPAPPGRRHWLRNILLIVIVVPLLCVTLWTWVSLKFTYSSGERAGFVQKLSKKGWVCKTWEGELAMANMPGAMPEIFRFTIRDDAVANAMNQSMGKRVSISYDQHIGIPNSCFGDTQYFVNRVQVIDK